MLEKEIQEQENVKGNQKEEKEKRPRKENAKEKHRGKEVEKKDTSKQLSLPVRQERNPSQKEGTAQSTPQTTLQTTPQTTPRTPRTLDTKLPPPKIDIEPVVGDTSFATVMFLGSFPEESSPTHPVNQEPRLASRCFSSYIGCTILLEFKVIPA